MNSHAYLRIAGYPIFVTKNYLSEWMFRKEDQFVGEVPANSKFPQPLSANGEMVQTYEFSASVKAMKRRLDILGFTLEAARREFHEACGKLSELANSWHDYILHEDVEIYDRKQLDEWLPAIRALIEDPGGTLQRAREETEGSAIFALLLRLATYLREADFPLHLGIPATSFNGAMRIALEAMQDEDRCVLDATELVEGGWISNFHDHEAIGVPTTRFYASYTDSTSSALSLLSAVPGNDVLLRMVYGNIITAMEAYMSDTARRFILSNPALLRRFVESDKFGLRDKKFSLSELFAKLDTINAVVQESLEKISFHNVADIKNVFNGVFQADIPEHLTDKLAAVVGVRHDIVHRNGNNLRGEPIFLNRDEVRRVFDLALMIVLHIDNFVRDTLLPKGDE
ncbi:HEPN/Toprim-associated domain-containing protein [Cupriavidus campinensis]|uniref:HEPN/Toprim N-terminal domain-containing protein n=1 Tax=Cupriavidus campinensis TaxID=151783 RepID=A0ABY3ET65_9BURK|nr:HEPN/Toprim-associated domain-containing protein [Cupriavidus campinensis]TSP14044.1 hypothetical protein FGG12_06125 [Cupriavidus campinensis]